MFTVHLPCLPVSSVLLHPTHIILHVAISNMIGVLQYSFNHTDVIIPCRNVGIRTRCLHGRRTPALNSACNEMKV